MYLAMRMFCYATSQPDGVFRNLATAILIHQVLKQQLLRDKVLYKSLFLLVAQRPKSSLAFLRSTGLLIRIYKDKWQDVMVKSVRSLRPATYTMFFIAGLISVERKTLLLHKALRPALIK